MLVLSRKQGQSIVIGRDIVVNVIDIGQGRVKIGVAAPLHMTIHRNEIDARIRKEASRRNSPICPSAATVRTTADCMGPA
jgi:carbon storage regulator